MVVITGLMVLMAKNSDILDVTGIIRQNKYISTITLVSSMLLAMSAAISILVLSLSVSVATMAKASTFGSSYEFEKILSFISGILIGIGVFVSLLAIIANFEAVPIGLHAMSGLVLSIAAALIAFSIAFSSIMLSISFATSQILLAYTAMLELLSMNKISPESMAIVVAILDNLLTVIGSTLLTLTAISAIFAIMGPNSGFAAAGLLAFGAAMFLISEGIFFVATAFSEIATAMTLLNSKNSQRFKDICDKVTNLVKWIIGALGVIAVASMAIRGISRRIVLVAAAFWIVSQSLGSIVLAIAMLAKTASEYDIDGAVDAIFKITTLIGVITTVLAVIGAIGGGWGALGVGIAAVGILAIAGTMNLMANSILAMATAISTYALAASKLEKVNGEKAANNIKTIAETLPDVLSTVKNSIPDIIDIVTDFLLGIGKGIVKGFFGAWAFAAGVIIANISGVIETLGSIIVGIIAGVLLILKDAIKELGPILIDIIMLLGPYLDYIAGWLGYWGFMCIESLLKGIIDAIYDLNWGEWIQKGINIIVTSVDIGIGNLFNKVALAVTKLGNYLRGYMHDIALAIVEETENLIIAIMPDEDTAALLGVAGVPLTAAANALLDNLEATRERLDGETEGIFSDTYMANLEAEARYAENARQNADDALAIYDSINEDIDSAIQNRSGYSRAPTMQWNTPGSRYDPSEYYAGLARNDSGWENEYRKTYDQATDFLGIFSDIFPEGGIFATIFGDGSTSILDSFPDFSDIFNVGDIGSMFDNVGNEIGESMGNNFGQSFSTSMSDTLSNSLPSSEEISNMYDLGNQDYSNLEDLEYLDYLPDPEKYEGISGALAKTASLPEEMKNPVISPVLDDTQFWKDYNSFENRWNAETYDEFAIDAGTSMLFRERADGNAASNGDVTYAYTQYNYSPEALSPIQIYRDTKNLIRGHIK